MINNLSWGKDLLCKAGINIKSLKKKSIFGIFLITYLTYTLLRMPKIEFCLFILMLR